MSALSIIATATRAAHAEPAGRARSGVIGTAHGPVHTPAFVPLATKATVRGLSAGEVAALGFDIVLGNTFHLFLNPGHELIAQLGGLHRFMRWDGPIVTDSGGFQVFSMGHGNVADEIKGRSHAAPHPTETPAAAAASAEEHATRGAILAIDEEGVRFRSYYDGRERTLTPEVSMAVQAALGSDIALAFDECTPFHVSRDYTARSTERTHRWLARCLAWHERSGPREQLVYGIVQGGVHEDLRKESAAAVAASGCAGIAIGGSLGRDKAQMHEVVDWTTRELERIAPERPRHLLGIGDVDDLIRGVELGIDTFDCALPTRLGRHGTALVADPENGWRLNLDRPRWRAAPEPISESCPCPACTAGYSRAYLHYLVRNRELTGMRLVTLHNLSFVARLMADLRAALGAGELAQTAAALRGGAEPRG